jgi:hypothetical protein
MSNSSSACHCRSLWLLFVLLLLRLLLLLMRLLEEHWCGLLRLVLWTGRRAVGKRA